MLDDTGESPPPSVYILDVDTLVWTRSITHAPAEEDNPGARSLHVTTVRTCRGASNACMLEALVGSAAAVSRNRSSCTSEGKACRAALLSQHLNCRSAMCRRRLV